MVVFSRSSQIIIIGEKFLSQAHFFHWIFLSSQISLPTHLSSEIECFPLKHFFNNFVTEKKNLRPAHFKKKIFFVTIFALHHLFFKMEGFEPKFFSNNFFTIKNFCKWNCFHTNYYHLRTGDIIASAISIFNLQSQQESATFSVSELFTVNHSAWPSTPTTPSVKEYPSTPYLLR